MAKRRGNGEGGIYKRNDGRWLGQYLVYTAKGPKLHQRTTVNFLSRELKSRSPDLEAKRKPLQIQGFGCALGRTRTCDLLIRSQTLYPAELRAHSERL